jgi:hypothetical protein
MRSQFDSLLSGLQNDRQPEGTLEQLLVEKLATLLWRYRRLMIAQVAETQKVEIFDWNFGPGLDLLLRYETSLERNFDRALTQLERLQQMRLGQPVAPPIKLDISSS